MTEGLYPPEGTPNGARFYANNHRSQVLFVLQWRSMWMRRPGREWQADSGLEFDATSPFAAGFTLGPRIPDPADLLRHDARVTELLEANSRLVLKNQRLLEHVAATNFLASARRPPALKVTRSAPSAVPGETSR